MNLSIELFCHRLQPIDPRIVTLRCPLPLHFPDYLEVVRAPNGTTGQVGYLVPLAIPGWLFSLHFFKNNGACRAYLYLLLRGWERLSCKRAAGVGEAAVLFWVAP